MLFGSSAKMYHHRHFKDQTETYETLHATAHLNIPVRGNCKKHSQHHHCLWISYEKYGVHLIRLALPR